MHERCAMINQQVFLLTGIFSLAPESAGVMVSGTVIEAIFLSHGNITRCSRKFTVAPSICRCM